ncbi:glycosyltransferase family 2 protein [Myxococcota bacterium]|nr:glycosyltransferase family 2 protein [Myxococcota bacterium]
MISVLIVSYRSLATLRPAFHSLTHFKDIVVVDNASDDDSVEMIRREFPHITLIANSTNRGFGAAMNQAAAAAQGDYLLLLNPDARLQEGALERLEALGQEWGDDTVLGFRQINAEGQFQLTVGPPPSLILEYGRKFLQRGFDLPVSYIRDGFESFLKTPRTVPWVGGSAILISRAAFETLGGFDERFFLYFEDIDLCLRARKAGYHVVFEPRETVIHEGGRSAANNQGLAERAYRDSQLYFWHKHRGYFTRHIVGFYLRLRGRSPVSWRPEVFFNPSDD